jgi:dTMP kinase
METNSADCASTKESRSGFSGLFVALDGPRGVGKTTLAGNLCDLAEQEGFSVETSHEPTAMPLGKFILENIRAYKGQCLNLLITADRHRHVHEQIVPALRQGSLVVSDRYIGSSLVFQRSDGVDPAEIWDLNRRFLIPDYYVFLDASPDILAARRRLRSPKDRFEHEIGIEAERQLWTEAKQYLAARSFPLSSYDTDTLAAQPLAERVLLDLRGIGLLNRCIRTE